MTTRHHISLIGSLLIPLLACRVDHQQRLVDLAAERLQCPEKDVRTSPFGDGGTQVATGCGQERKYTWLNGWVEMQDLRKRAAFDLSCNPAQIQILPLSSSSAGVSGCGKQATYVYKAISASGLQVGYDWAMNSSS